MPPVALGIHLHAEYVDINTGRMRGHMAIDFVTRPTDSQLLQECNCRHSTEVH